MTSSNATARGTLGTTPLGELLVFCLQRRLSGSLVFDSKEGNRSALSLRNGVVQKSKLGTQACLLGDVCVRLGYFDEQLLSAALKSKRSGRLGQHLVDSLLIEAEQLQVALGVQLLEQVEWCSRLPHATVYGYYEDDFLASWAGEPLAVDPLALIWRASRSADAQQRARAICRGFGDRVLRLHANSRIGRFDFDRETAPALNVLRAKPQTYAELRDSGLAKEDPLNRVLSVLALTQHLDTGTSGTPLDVDAVSPAATDTGAPDAPIPDARQRRLPRRPGETTHSPTEPPPAVAETSSDPRRLEIKEMAEKIVGLSFYDVLGVTSDAAGTTIQQAFFQLARKWHPDRLGPELSDQREAATRIFARMAEAQQVLGTPAQRAEYDRLLQAGTTSQEEQEQVQQILRAATAFQKAEILARREDWAAAEKAAEKAHRDDPEQVEYGALYAWVVAKSGQRAKAGDYDDLLTILKDAVQAEPNNIRIRLYRGQVLKLAGRADLAMREFRAISDIDPNHVEAAREIRLHRMRSASNEGAEGEGLFGRFFKKG